jgi:hypothetical protein
MRTRRSAGVSRSQNFGGGWQVQFARYSEASKVTCRHVWQAYLSCRTENPDAALGINLGYGDASIAFAFPERQLIDADADLDLVVFDFEPSQIRVNKTQVNHQKDWFPIRQWPIAKASHGEHVALMGFSGKQIQERGHALHF